MAGGGSGGQEENFASITITTRVIGAQSIDFRGELENSDSLARADTYTEWTG